MDTEIALKYVAAILLATLSAMRDEVADRPMRSVFADLGRWFTEKWDPRTEEIPLPWRWFVQMFSNLWHTAKALMWAIIATGFMGMTYHAVIWVAVFASTFNLMYHYAFYRGKQ